MTEDLFNKLKELRNQIENPNPGRRGRLALGFAIEELLKIVEQNPNSEASWLLAQARERRSVLLQESNQIPTIVRDQINKHYGSVEAHIAALNSAIEKLLVIIEQNPNSEASWLLAHAKERRTVLLEKKGQLPTLIAMEQYQTQVMFSDARGVE